MADQKLTALAALDPASLDDVLYIVDNPGGSPVSKKVSVQALLAALSFFGAIGINSGGAGNRYAWLDLVGDDTYAYGARIIRNNSGPNADTVFYHRGIGAFTFVAQEAANMFFLTSGTTRMTIQSGGTVYVEGTLSAATLTDRTAGPKDKTHAHELVDSLEWKDGKLDYDKIHKDLLVETTFKNKDTGEELRVPGRDLTLLVSSLCEVVKDLKAELAELKERLSG